jgi:hypothetical protein
MVEEKMKDLYASGALVKCEVGRNVLQRLSVMDPNGAVDLLDEFASQDLSRITNNPGFLVSQLSRNSRGVAMLGHSQESPKGSSRTPNCIPPYRVPIAFLTTEEQR